MKKRVRATIITAIVAVLTVCMIALTACASNLPIDVDKRIGKLAKALNEGITGELEQARIINALTRAGIELDDEVYNKLRDSAVKAIKDNALGDYDMGKVSYTAMALMYNDIKLPDEIISYINDKSYCIAGNERYNEASMLPVAIMAKKLGYDIAVIDDLKANVLKTVTGDIIQPFYPGFFDDMCMAIIGLASFDDQKEMIEKSVDWLEEKMPEILGGDKTTLGYTNTVGKILNMAVELDYYGVAHSIEEQSIYKAILSAQGDSGMIMAMPYGGNELEEDDIASMQALEDLSAYMLYKNNGTTFWTVTK